jgi:hypothetical protein
MRWRYVGHISLHNTLGLMARSFEYLENICVKEKLQLKETESETVLLFA